MDTPGHVFIVQGDIRKLACDAWLMPCDLSMRPLDNWTSYPEPLPLDFVWPDVPDDWESYGRRAVRLDGWPRRAGQPWLVHVGASPSSGIDWYVEGARQYLEAAANDLDGKPPQYGRARHLLALPVVGTRYGGAKRHAGEVIRKLLPLMNEVARRSAVDVALVTNDGPTFAAAQNERTTRRDRWASLDDALFAEAGRLAALAGRGELVLFLGAGVSAGAGLTTWGRLLKELAVRAGVTEAEVAVLDRLPMLDQARIIGGRLGHGKLGPAVVETLQTDHHSLTHALLACLPVREIVTTNYDRLFELASEGVGQRVAVLPHMAVAGTERWILKMHGCVTHPDDIVLTREDYIRYAERRAALAGIVQALLITRHMLFVGFSLEDDNFHRIVDAVRKAIHMTPDAGRVPFGTTLMLARNRLLEELWSDDLGWVAMSEPVDPWAFDPATARRLEIFLDRLLAETDTRSAHILDRRYAAVLGESDEALRDALVQFRAGVPPLARRSAAWSQVEALFERLGGEPTRPGRALVGGGPVKAG